MMFVKYKPLIIVSLVLLLAGILVAVMITGKRPEPIPASSEDETLVGGDTDQYGCLIAAGYSWCESKQKCLRDWEEPCGREEAFNFLNNFKNSATVEFSGIGNTDFIWVVNETTDADNAETVEGRSMETLGISAEDAVLVETQLQELGFTADANNLAENNDEQITGYQNANMVCLFSVHPDTAEEDTTEKIVRISCGLLN